MVDKSEEEVRMCWCMLGEFGRIWGGKGRHEVVGNEVYALGKALLMRDFS